MGLLAEQAAAIAGRERSSVELVTEAVTAAEKLQPVLNAFTEIYADEAIAAAREADAREPTGSLHGVPVAVKDLFDVAGRVTTAGSGALRDSPPASSDAPAVRALRDAGAVIIGKTNMHELAFGGTTSVSYYGPANNPWDPERAPGGSSGGSAAAVAARVVGLALGTDTGGSVRIPSAFCGTTGLKTTWGLLSTAGVVPMTPTLDSVGPIASDALDDQIGFEILTGDHRSRLDDASVRGLRVGVARGAPFDNVHDEVATAMSAAEERVASLGARMSDAELPWFDLAYEAWIPISIAEFGREHRALQQRLDDLDPTTQIILQAGIGLPGEDEHRARELAVQARAGFAETMREFDVLLLPTIAFTAPRHTDEVTTVGSIELPTPIFISRLTRSINVLPAAALSFPIGFGPTGLPISAQLVGARGSEHRLLAAGVAFQRETDWHLRVPPVHA